MTPETTRARRDRRGEIAVVVLAILAGLFAAAAGSPRSATPVRVGEGDVVTRGDLPGRTVLLVHKDSQRTVDVVALFGFEDGNTGDVLLIPPSTLVEVPSLASSPLADVVKSGSADLLILAVENLVGVAVDEFVIADSQRLANAFAPSVQLDVELPHDLQSTDELGTLSLTAGRQTIDAPTAVRALIDPEHDRGELEHQVTIRSIVEAWRHTLTDQRVADAVDVADPSLTTFVERAGAQLRYDTLPVDVTKVGDETHYRARRAELNQLVVTEYKWALLNDGDARPRVEIRNGTANAYLTVKASQVVVRAGGEVSKTGNDPNSGVTHSVVGYEGDGDRTAAETLARALGIATVEKAAEADDGVDVTVLLGADFVPPP